jgi:hypothetical protein
MKALALLVTLAFAASEALGATPTLSLVVCDPRCRTVQPLAEPERGPSSAARESNRGAWLAQREGSTAPESGTTASRGEIVAWVALGVAVVSAALSTWALIEAREAKKDSKTTAGRIALNP